jgi:hypothetical protein
MNDGIDIGPMQAVYERLTRLEERGVARDDRMGRMEEALERLAKQVEVIGADVRDAKTGLRVALWISNTIWPLLAAGGGWVAAHFWHWK